MTREKEDGTLDLLLSTPITSRYYIWGKLRGLVAFVLPLVAVPVASAFLFIAHDLLRWLAERRWKFSVDRVSRSADYDAGDADHRLRVRGDSGDADVAALPDHGAGGDEQRGDHRGGCARRWDGAGIPFSPVGMPSELAVAIGTFSPFTLLTILIDPNQFAGAAFSIPADPMNYDPAGARIDRVRCLRSGPGGVCAGDLVDV